MNFFDYELSDALQALEYEEDSIEPKQLRVTLLALLARIRELETALRGHGHDGFRTY